MEHSDVFAMFQSKFEHVDVIHWFPNGKDSVRVRTIDDVDMVFTYHSASDWKLESIDSYLLSLKG